MKVACSLRHECLPSGDALGTIAAGIMRAVSATSSPVARARAFFGSYCVDTLGLERVIFGADNLDEPKRFFTDWGLQRVSTTRSRVAFATRNGSQLQVWRDDAGGLAPRVGPDGQFREFVLAMKTQRDVDRVGDDIARDRAVEQQPDGRLRFQDDAGITLSVIVSTRGRVDPPKAQAFNQPGNRGRVNAIANVHTQAAPWQIGHIVFFVPDVNEAEAFYRQQPEIRTSHIFVEVRPGASKEEDKKARDRIQNIYDTHVKTAKMSFAEIAQKFSEGVAAPMGGDIDYQTRDRLDPQYYDTALKLREPGKVSGVVRTRFGYHIIRLTAVRSWKDVDRAKIKRLAFEDRRQKLFDDYMSRLRKSASVQVKAGLLK